MKTYTALLGVLALLSSGFMDGKIKPIIAKVGPISGAVFTGLFVS